MPLAIRRKALLWFMAATLCCEFSLLAGESTNKPTTKIVIDSSVTQKTLPAWLAYAGARAVWMEKRFQEHHPEAVEYRYSFEEEFEAREACLHVWSRLREA